MVGGRHRDGGGEEHYREREGCVISWGWKAKQSAQKEDEQKRKYDDVISLRSSHADEYPGDVTQGPWNMERPKSGVFRLFPPKNVARRTRTTDHCSGNQ